MLAIIPARGGSKGIPGKNIKNIGGKPLLQWTIEQALNCSLITDVVVSTDCTSIAEVARSCGASVPFLRPPELSDDCATTESVIEHVIQYLSSVGVDHSVAVLLQPTSPVRCAGSIERCYQFFSNGGYDSVLSVVKDDCFHWMVGKDGAKATYDYANRPRRQDIDPSSVKYRENGSMYMFRVAGFSAHQNRLHGKIGLYVMQGLEGFEIDEPLDWVLVESILDNYCEGGAC